LIAHATTSMPILFILKSGLIPRALGTRPIIKKPFMLFSKNVICLGFLILKKKSAKFILLSFTADFFLGLNRKILLDF